MADFLMGPGDLNATDTVLLASKRTAYNGGDMALYQSSFEPDPTSVVGDFEAAEADFTGYARVTLAMEAIAPDSDGGYVSISNSGFFQATDGVAPNTIGGIFFETAAGAILSYYPFPVPIGITGALQYLQAILYLREPGEDSVEVNS